MKLSEIKSILSTAQGINFKLTTGENVPENFHVTEVGIVTKHFIDCGGTERVEKLANFQLWDANDYEHRLKPQKLLNIITLCEQKLSIGDFEIEVEYQQETIGKYGLHYTGSDFVLTPKQTACLAQEQCGVPTQKQHLNETAKVSCCSPASGCC